MKLSAAVLISLCSVGAFAQDTGSAAPGTTTITNPNPIVTLASGFLEHNFFNVYAYGNGVYDTYAPIERNGVTVNNGSFGYEVGGGINGTHALRGGNFSLSYQGGYRSYNSQSYSSGTYQNLSIGLYKRLTRRWTFSWSANGGIFLFGGAFFTPDPNLTTSVVTNPFSSETKFASTGVTFAYQQTRHLSYIFSGNLFLQRYNYSGGIGTTGTTGSVGVQYHFAPRSFVSGYYAHSYYKYQRNIGEADIDSLSMSLTHIFPAHWTVTLSGGASRSNTSGIVTVPVTLIVGNQAVGGYFLGRFQQVSWVPSFSGNVSHNWRRYVLSIGGGQGVNAAGNGYYLTSRTEYLYGVASRGFRRSNISAAGGYQRLSSVANAVSSTFISTSLSATYGVNLVRYVGAFVRY
ncbi:MAG: hypothetical protein JO091_02725, partial [Acidobacteriaceae bacterium]|nr:hypothetical protein [Acidobacteriaceae bacterium]